MTSPRLRSRDSASRGLIQAAVSHVNFVSGFGASCSQPLFANRPSKTYGSGRKINSRPPAVCGAGADVGVGAGAVCAALAGGAAAGGSDGAAAVGAPAVAPAAVAV